MIVCLFGVCSVATRCSIRILTRITWNPGLARNWWDLVFSIRTDSCQFTALANWPKPFPLDIIFLSCLPSCPVWVPAGPAGGGDREPVMESGASRQLRERSGGRRGGAQRQRQRGEDSCMHAFTLDSVPRPDLQWPSRFLQKQVKHWFDGNNNRKTFYLKALKDTVQRWILR